MTEAEWLACEHADLMLAPCEGRDRKMRLYACAWARISLPDLHPGVYEGEVPRPSVYETGVDVAERVADAEALEEERAEAERKCDYAADEYRCDAQWQVMDCLIPNAAVAARSSRVTNSHACYFLPTDQPWRTQSLAEWESLSAAEQEHRETMRKAAYDRAAASARVWQANLLRDIFGNPFRPVLFSSEWRTSTAVALAAQMYESRDFAAMPILADALQDAGCDNSDVLAHCRDTKATHVRGCWVVDLVLGKT